MFSFLRRTKKKHEAEPTETYRKVFERKYSSFRQLLTENNAVLELMAEIEEKSCGDYLFDMNYMSPKIEEISQRVARIIRHLNDLASDRYLLLNDAHASIRKNIDMVIRKRFEIPAAEYVLPIHGLQGDMKLVAGGKMAHLGEMKNRLNLPVPDGFVITSSSFKKFMDYHGFHEKLSARLVGLNLRDMNGLQQGSREFQEMMSQAEIPQDVELSIRDACDDLWRRLGGRQAVSVRSSAIFEDGDFSFAGQYTSFLNVKPEQILQKYKEVIASLFTSRALFYAATKGFSGEEMVMAVGVMNMIPARSGGVLYSQDPNGQYHDVMLIAGSWGLAKSVVDGIGKTDRFLVSRTTGEITDRWVAEKEVMLTGDEGGGTRSVKVAHEDRALPCLSDAQIHELVRCVMVLEGHFSKPQDVEWSTDSSGKVYLLQSRPLRIAEQKEMKGIPRRLKAYPLLIDKGIVASRGVGYGKVHMVRDESDLGSFPEGAVLVSRTTSTKYVTVMDRASAIVTDVGGVAGHMASLAREYRIPAILDTDIATRVLHQGQEITVDAINCNVYAGEVKELLEYTQRKKDDFCETGLFQTVKQVMKFIVPLHLVDPDDMNFRPEACTSFHDITRFSHEKAMAEMFGMSDTHEMKDEHTITLIAGIPVEAHVLDVGGGVRDSVERAMPEDILSVPFGAFLKGLTAMKWPEPRAADVKGFFGMMAHAASIPEGEIHETAIRSFAVLSGHYMNFSIRLGYHFQMVEAFASDTMNDNYIRFFFKGGGADRDRRLRRVRLIGEILKMMDFKVRVVEDVIDAVLLKFKGTSIEQRLEAMGRLTVYTKQLDMAMYNDDITDWYRDEFVRDHIKEIT